MKRVHPIPVLVRWIAMIELAIFGGVGMVCWLIGARTPAQYGLSVHLAGLLCMGIGLITAFADRVFPPSMHSAPMPIRQEHKGVVYREANDRFAGLVGVLGFAIMMSAAGLAPAVVGLVLVNLYQE